MMKNFRSMAQKAYESDTPKPQSAFKPKLKKDEAGVTPMGSYSSERDFSRPKEKGVSKVQQLEQSLSLGDDFVAIGETSSTQMQTESAPVELVPRSGFV